MTVEPIGVSKEAALLVACMFGMLFASSTSGRGACVSRSFELCSGSVEGAGVGTTALPTIEVHTLESVDVSGR